MKRFLLFGLALLVGGCSWFPRQPAQNPDPNHLHADVAVWVGGTKLDFSDERYMSEPPAESARVSALSLLIPGTSAHGDEEDGHVVPGREYLHLHDGNGHVIHVHKPGLAIGDFFTSIGLTVTSDCLTLDEYLFAQLDADWVDAWARTRDLCADGKFHWTMIVNGERLPMDPTYVIKDVDRILLSYGSSDTAADEEFVTMTDDACLYSKTCPWRGEPPTENCIADPAVPCVAPLE
ncbi:hypothetical protein HYZ99_05590 [Candidatus Peregrinibacteria bacterium]|nr:hypothetical protein [Candidatus Peregrinibacteria bacterium]